MSGRAVSTLHSSMAARDRRARFTHPDSGSIVEPGRVSHRLEEVTGAAEAARLRVARFPGCEKYV